MAEKKTEPGDPGLDSVRSEMAKLQAQVAAADPSAPLLAIKAQLDQIETMMIDLRKDVPRFTAQIPVSLKADEVEQLLGTTPDARLIALNNHPGSGLRPGDAFEPRNRFTDQRQMLSLIRGGHLQVSRAA